MVATRNHPSTFPSPDLKPSKEIATHAKPYPTHPWRHTPKALTLLWLILSLPLVAWDSGYVIFRPHTMLGGKWHQPLYTPYALYATVDYMYGWPAYESGNGFTLAQGSLNVLESIGYLAYLYVFCMHGEGQWVLVEGQRRSIRGGWGGLACLLGFSIGHNSFSRLVWLWILPNGAWLLLPAYMIYAFGKDILQGLSIAGGDQGSQVARAIKPNSSPRASSKSEKRNTVSITSKGLVPTKGD